MDKCSICLDDFAANPYMTKLSCSHTFHSDCIMTWFRKGNPACPVCRDGAAPGAPDGGDDEDNAGVGYSINDFIQSIMGPGARAVSLDTRAGRVGTHGAQCPSQ